MKADKLGFPVDLFMYRISTVTNLLPLYRYLLENTKRTSEPLEQQILYCILEVVRGRLENASSYQISSLIKEDLRQQRDLSKSEIEHYSKWVDEKLVKFLAKMLKEQKSLKTTLTIIHYQLKESTNGDVKKIDIINEYFEVFLTKQSEEELKFLKSIENIKLNDSMKFEYLNKDGEWVSMPEAPKWRQIKRTGSFVSYT